MASSDTITALCQVIQHELPSAIESVTLDLERARMEREDFRQGNTVSPHVGKPSNMTLRQHFDELSDNFDDACTILSDIRHIAKDELDGSEDKIDFALAVIEKVGDMMDDPDDESRSSAEEESVA